MGTRTAGSIVACLLLLGTACSDDGQAEIDTVDDDESDQDGADTSGEDTSAETDGNGDEGGEEEQPALLLVMDASGSMNDEDDSGTPLIDGAQDALVDVVDGLPDDQEVGLRVYGHTYSEDDPSGVGCTDTELIHPVEPLDREALTSTINGFDASGYTPIARSLEEGAADLPGEGPRTMILVSDGEETCDGDPCAVAEDIRADGIDLIIHTVGFALERAGADRAEQAREELTCIADEGGGSYVEVDEADDLDDAVEEAREDRSFEAEGGELTGAPIPRDADTGAPDTAYTDTVLGTEENYYRFEVPSGSVFQGEVVLEPNPDAACRETGALDRMDLKADLRDAGGDTIDLATGLDQGSPSGAPLVAHSDPVDLEGRDEVWLWVDTACAEAADDEFDVEVRLTTVE